MRKTQRRFIGRRFGYLTVLDVFNSNNRSYMVCKCDCGVTKEILTSNVIGGRQKSCGCRLRFMRENGLLRRTHGKTKHPLYKKWNEAIRRCYDPKYMDYKNYGGRGIRVTPKWKNDFMNFYNWAMENGYKKGLFLGRKNPNKGYNPDNCFFGTRIEVLSNRRDSHKITYKGRTQTVSAWARELHTHPQTIQQRLDLYGWTPEEAIGTPIKRRRKL